MARRFTTGFELGEVLEHNGSYGSNGLVDAVVATPVRTGGYAWRPQNLANSVLAYTYCTHTLADDPTELYVRFAFRHTGLEGTVDDSYEAVFAVFDEAGDAHLSLGLAANDFLLRVKTGGTGALGQTGGSVVDTGSAVLTADTWWVIEVYISIANSGGQVTVKVNGATDISYTGDTQVGSTDGIRAFRFGAHGVGNNTGITKKYLDDIAVNDTSGSQQNSWIGQGGVYLLKPSADGTQNDWTPSAGADNYALVDEVPASATDYISSDTSTDIDLFELEDLPAEIVDVDLIEALFQAALAETGSNSVKHLIRHSGTNYDGDTEAIVTVDPNYALYKSAPVYEVLGSSGAWTPAQVNALESGVEVV